MNRVGNAILAFVGFVIAAVMVYSLAPRGFWTGTHATGAGRAATAEVAVYFPERLEWVEFRQAIEACLRRGLARQMDAGDDAVVLATARHGRLVRFALHDVRGLWETKEDVRRLLEQRQRPLAVVGSVNTVLTTALARAVRDSSERLGQPAPVLLVPWATSVLGESEDSGEDAIPLLAINQGRTFRFGVNNQDQAVLLVRCLTDHDPGAAPSRVDFVVDRNDPYSVDLADCFHRVIERRFKDVELVEHAHQSGSLGPALIPGLPGPLEEALADAIWRAAERLTPGRAWWVILPLQDEPARRMLLAIRRHARPGREQAGRSLRVLCGDGIVLKDLAELAGDCPFAVWSFSQLSLPISGRAADPVLAKYPQVCAEVVSALLHGLDRPAGTALTPDGLRDALAALRLRPDDPGAFGRSLAFAPSGERLGNDVGHILMIRPGSRTVLAFERTDSGTWSAPVPVDPVPVASSP